VRCGEKREYDVITACHDFAFGKATFEAVYLLSLLPFTLTEPILLECVNAELVKERVYIFY
jgi:hypothetical protein